MLTDFNASVKQVFIGNILFAVCCIFYLLWWILAFKPTNPMRGFKTGWLLIPASLAGIIAVIIAIHGIVSVHLETRLMPNSLILGGGIVVYSVIMLITSKLLKRPVTTELILIIGWLMLALAEINALYGQNTYSLQKAVIFIILSAVATIINLVCYVLYYKLDNTAGFIDGTIPLALVLLLTVGIDMGMVIR
jgi:hypothetical protein